MKRIMIIGFSGAGKSTLARKLGELLNITPTYIDSIHWLPGWVENSDENKKKILARVLENDCWIIDGSYRKLLWERRLELCDTIIYLDINRFTCFKNACIRRIKYNGKTRPDMGKGCEERLNLEFAKWVLIDGRKKRTKTLETVEKMKQSKSVYVFKSTRQVNKWLNELKGMIKNESPNELVQ